jgi:hypothetical protein
MVPISASSARTWRELMQNSARAGSHKALACALLVLATAAGVRGANEYVALPLSA